MTTTNKTSFTLQDVLEAEVGDTFRISSENELYGTTVEKAEHGIINHRTKEVMPLTAELVTSKFRSLVKQELTLEAMLEAYHAGRKIRIELDERYRIVQKESIPTEIQEFINNLPLPLQAYQESDMISFEELTNAKFYLV